MKTNTINSEEQGLISQINFREHPAGAKGITGAELERILDLIEFANLGDKTRGERIFAKVKKTHDQWNDDRIKYLITIPVDEANEVHSEIEFSFDREGSYRDFSEIASDSVMKNMKMIFWGYRVSEDRKHIEKHEDLMFQIAKNIYCMYDKFKQKNKRGLKR